jgi:hypothetical protein
MTFKQDLLDDLDEVFFDTDDFADTATWTPTGGAAVSVNGLFDSHYQADLGVANYRTVFRCRTIDIPGAKAADSVVINAVSYTIVGPPENVGDGTTRLYLTRSAP